MFPSLRASLIAIATVSIASLANAQVDVQDASARKDLAKKAASAFKQQDWKTAAKAYSEMVKTGEVKGQVWYRLGYALHSLGKYEGALKAHLRGAKSKDKGVQVSSTYNAACVYAIQNKPDQAIEWLKKAIKVGFSDSNLLSKDPDMDNIRDDKRFAKLAKYLSSMPKKAKKGKKKMSSSGYQAYTPVTKRASARVAYFGNNGSPGQLALNYGQPQWKDKYDDAIASDKLIGKRWRLGSDFWTNIDSSVGFNVNGVQVPAGYYYMTLEHNDADEFVLAFIDPVKCRKFKLDPYAASKTKGGIETTLHHKESKKIAEKLEMGFKMSDEQNTKGKFFIHFGPHLLLAKFAIDLEIQ